MKLRAVPLTITLGSILLFFCLVLTILWNFILIYNYSQLKEFAGPIKEYSGYFQWVILGIGSFFFVVVITGVLLFMIFLARQLMLNQLQSSFIDSVTHELKTPLTSIKLYIETLKKHDLPKDKKDSFLEIMLKDVERLNTLVDHVLEASKLEHLNKSYEYKEINLENIIKYCSEIIINRYNLPERMITIKSIPTFIKSDPAALELAFINLIDNAVKYSEGNIQVFIEIVQNNSNVEVIIKDSGVGISKSEIKKIFKRFYRIKDESNERVKGSGLGLFIVKQILDRLKAKIEVISEGKDMGTEFIVTFENS